MLCSHFPGSLQNLALFKAYRIFTICSSCLVKSANRLMMSRGTKLIGALSSPDADESSGTQRDSFKLGRFSFLLFVNEFNCTLNWWFWLVLLSGEWSQWHTKPESSVHLRIRHGPMNGRAHLMIDWMASIGQNGKKSPGVFGQGT